MLPAGWNRIGSDGSATLYLDPQSLRREGAIVILRTLTQLAEADGAGSLLGLIENDCAQRSMRQLRSKQFAGRFGSGAVLADNQVAGTYRPLVPGTLGEVLFTAACKAPGSAP
jgi:hypothetical protein